MQGPTGPASPVASDPVGHPPIRNAVPDAVAPPPGNPRFPAVDGLRAVAALAVVVFHACQFSHATGLLGRLASHLDVGVAIFFAISGFLLYRPYFASAVGDTPRTPARIFYWRRMLRIVPAYWVALLVLAPILTFAHPAGIPDILFLQIYRPAWARTGIAPGWSVCVEVSFYLLLPAFAGLLGRRWSRLGRQKRRRAELRLLAVLAIGSLALRALVRHFVHNPYAVDPLPATFAWFCAGMSLAIVSVEPGRWGRGLGDLASEHPGWIWAVALLVYVATVEAKGSIETYSIVVFVAYGVIAGLVLTPLVLGRSDAFAGARFLLTRPLAWLGLVSYGIYLYHYPLMHELHPGSSPTADLLIFAAFGAVAATACGSLSYYIVERPALSLKRVPASSWLRRLLGVDAAR